MSKWKEFKFSDFVAINPSVKFANSANIPFVEMKDLTDGQKYCSPNSVRNISGGSRFQNEDTLFARITPCLENGKIAKVKGLKDGYGLGSTEFLVFRGIKGLSDNDFVYYLSRWEEVRSFAELNLDGTSGRQRVPKGCFNELILNFPDLTVQNAITTVLSSLDDKIDLLQRQNSTLEAMAETLFRQWFVEEAKEEWAEISLYDAIDLVGGGTPKTSVPEYWDGCINWLSGGDIANNHKSIVVSSERKITEKGLKNSSANLLPKYSTVISARGTVGKYCILSEPMTYSQSNYGIKPKFKNCYFFTYLLINHSVEELLSAAYGSVFDTITTSTFKGHSVCLPNSDSIEEFEVLVQPYFLKIMNNQTQIHTLTALRDNLLPKLMSGEVRVKDV